MKINELRVSKYLDPKGIIASDKVTDGVKDQIKRRKLLRIANSAVTQLVHCYKTVTFKAYFMF